MTMTTIALSKLIPSPANVRKTGGVSIDDLAASILANGLLQNLTVVEAGNGKYAVIAGGRRLKALKRLAREKRIPKSHPVPCLVREAGEATELSLAENTVREAMHPADQFEAFRQLADEQHLSPADIANRFGTSETHVARLLKLGRVAPELLDRYRAGDIDLNTVMAFTLTDDHDRQRAIYAEARKGRSLREHTIRRLLTDEKTPLSDKRVTFVGLDAYREAGGTVTRDLFSEREGGYLDDPLLLARLVNDKLSVAASEIEAGWKWIEVHAEDFPSLYGPEYRHAPEGAGETLRPYTGVLIGIGNDGALRVETAILRKGDRLPADPASPSKAKPKAEISASLLEDLTAHRTQAMRAVMTTNPDVAFDAMLYSLTAREFYGERQSDLCARLGIERVFLGQRVEATPAAQVLDEARNNLQARLPEDQAGLWVWLREADRELKHSLLAYLIATSIDVTQRGGSEARPLSHELHQALDLNLTHWWTPTAENYFGRVRRDQVLEALKEIGEAETYALAKKRELAAIAERRITGTGWLPKPLRPLASENLAATASEDLRAAA